MSESDADQKDEYEQFKQHFTDNGTVYASYLTTEQIRDAINGLSELETADVVFNLNNDDARDAFNHFSVASKAVECIENDMLSVFASDNQGGSSIVKTNEIVNIMYGTHIHSKIDDIDSFRNIVSNEISDVEKYTIRTPSLMALMDCIDSTFGDEFVIRFNKLLDEAKMCSDTIDDGVILMLLTGAYENVLLYEVGRCGEDVHLASQATFSRYKKKLEAIDIITTQKVPRDIGRPRQRLLLTDEAKNMDEKELIKMVSKKL